MGAIISMPKTLSDEESLPGEGPRPINLRRSGHLPGSEPTYGWCLCCCCGGALWGGASWRVATTLRWKRKIVSFRLVRMIRQRARNDCRHHILHFTVTYFYLFTFEMLFPAIFNVL